jgi:hypothetical protein
MVCCGYRGAVFDQNPIDALLNGVTDFSTIGYNACGSGTSNVDGYMTTWSSDNTNIMSVQPRKATGISVGSTNANAEAPNFPARGIYDGVSCPVQYTQDTGTGNVSGATPVNFKASAGTASPDGTLAFTYSWEASSGNLNDLSQCKAGETVLYPGSAATYTWPLPMHNNGTINNPTTIYGSASSGGFTDQQRPPDSYVKPYSSASFRATQRLQWECPYNQNGGYIGFTPDITITRSISQPSSGVWQYTVTKSNTTATANLP